MKCCTYYVEFLRKLGVFDRVTVQSNLSVPVIGVDGSRSILYRAPLPVPLHMGPAVLFYQHLSVGDKVAVAKAMMALRSMPSQTRAALDGTSFYDWLTKQGQPEWAVVNFWDLIVLPTLNDDSRRVSAAQAIMVLQEGFLSASDAADIGVSSVGLSSLLYEEATRYIESRGGQVFLGRSVRGLEGTEEGIRSVGTYEDQRFIGDVFVLAVPPRPMLALLPDGWAEQPFFAPATNLKTSPIVNMHLWLDRPVTRHPFAAYLNSHIQWVFAKPADTKGQHLVISISGAHKYIDMPKHALHQLLVDELRERIPEARKAKVLAYTIIRERDATFSAEPGSAAWRLPARTPVPNLFLAGAWTSTGWPATMESAVRSGVFCAGAVAASV